MPRISLKTTTKTSCISKDEMTNLIRKKAQEFYEKSGRKPGRDLENWLQAEKAIKAHFKIS